MLAYLDGSLDCDALVNILQGLAEGKIEAHKEPDSAPTEDADLSGEDWAGVLKEKLARLAGAALLVG